MLPTSTTRRNLLGLLLQPSIYFSYRDKIGATKYKTETITSPDDSVTIIFFQTIFGEAHFNTKLFVFTRLLLSLVDCIEMLQRTGNCSDWQTFEFKSTWDYSIRICVPHTHTHTQEASHHHQTIVKVKTKWLSTSMSGQKFGVPCCSVVPCSVQHSNMMQSIRPVDYPCNFFFHTMVAMEPRRQQIVQLKLEIPLGLSQPRQYVIPVVKILYE
jgi:hypothetical protein